MSQVSVQSDYGERAQRHKNSQGAREGQGVQDRGSEEWREMTHEQGLDGSTGDHQEDKAGRELQTESMKYYTGVPEHTASTAYSETK